MEKLNTDALARRREYLREWRAKNRDKVREYNLRYWARRVEREAKTAEQAERQKKEGKANNG